MKNIYIVLVLIFVMWFYVLILCIVIKYLYEVLVFWNFNKMLKLLDEILKLLDDVLRIMMIYCVLVYVDMIWINIRYFFVNCE